ncbi:hypothetical protein FPQ18DRAFT_396405 [Pyronema domesticum]|nr:hypothetical protein FPQ18DRAFT_396405 [Pyronema domesticum]
MKMHRKSDSEQPCPRCDAVLPPKELRAHLGEHMQQIALLVVSGSYYDSDDDEDDKDDKEEKYGEGDEDSEDDNDDEDEDKDKEERTKDRIESGDIPSISKGKEPQI